MKKKPATIIELIIKDLNELIEKTNDPQAIYPLEAAKELIIKRKPDQKKFASYFYDEGASARHPYARGSQFYSDKFE